MQGCLPMFGEEYLFSLNLGNRVGQRGTLDGTHVLESVILLRFLFLLPFLLMGLHVQPCLFVGGFMLFANLLSFLSEFQMCLFAGGFSFLATGTDYAVSFVYGFPGPSSARV